MENTETATLENTLADLDRLKDKQPCKNCSKPFRPKNDQHQHCSDRCRKQYNKKGKIGHKVEAMIRSVVKEEVAKVIPELKTAVDRAVEVLKRQERLG